jgi:hypothetical protein
MTKRIGLTTALNVPTASQTPTGAGGVFADAVIPIKKDELRLGGRVEVGGKGVGLAGQAQFAIPLTPCKHPNDIFTVVGCPDAKVSLTPALAVGVDLGSQTHPYGEASLGIEVSELFVTAGISLGLRAPFDHDPVSLTGRAYLGVQF